MALVDTLLLDTLILPDSIFMKAWPTFSTTPSTLPLHPAVEKNFQSPYGKSKI